MVLMTTARLEQYRTVAVQVVTMVVLLAHPARQTLVGVVVVQGLWVVLMEIDTVVPVDQVL